MCERVKLYRVWKDDEALLVKKREVKVRFELAHKSDKISEAAREITEVFNDCFAKGIYCLIGDGDFNHTYFMTITINTTNNLDLRYYHSLCAMLQSIDICVCAVRAEGREESRIV